MMLIVLLMVMYFKYSEEEITTWTIVSLIVSPSLFKLLWKWITAIGVVVDAIAVGDGKFKKIIISKIS